MGIKIREVVVREAKPLKASDRQQVKAKSLGLTAFDYYQRSTFASDVLPGTERSYRSRRVIVRDEDGRTVADLEIGDLSGFLKGVEYATRGTVAIPEPFVPPAEATA